MLIYSKATYEELCGTKYSPHAALLHVWAIFHSSDRAFLLSWMVFLRNVALIFIIIGVTRVLVLVWYSISVVLIVFAVVVLVGLTGQIRSVGGI